MILAFLLISVRLTWAAPPGTEPEAGIRDKTLAVHAFTGARVVVGPGRAISNATLIVRDGVVEAVGRAIDIPPEARVWDLSGKTIYPGLIDSFRETAVSLPTGGAPHWNPHVTPQRAIAPVYASDKGLDEKYRKMGVTARLVAPQNGIIKGISALVTTGDELNGLSVVNDAVGQHMRLTIQRGNREQYPNSPMGAVALARQTLLDADWYARSIQARNGNPATPAVERNDALDALQSITANDGLVIVDAINELYFLRADQFAREFSLNAIVRGSGFEYRRLAAIRDTGRPILVPVNFPKPPNVGSPEAARQVNVVDLMHWDIAPENAARLHAQGVEIALTSHGLNDVAEFLKNVRRAVSRGLPKDAALRALTTTPARLFGVADQLGTLQRGRLANFVVVDKDLFATDAKILETWVRGKRYAFEPKPGIDVTGSWNVDIRTGEKSQKSTLKLTGEAKKLAGELTGPDGKAIKLDRVSLRGARLSAVFAAAGFKQPDGYAQLSGVISGAGSKQAITGYIVWPQGKRADLTARREPATEEDEQKSDDDQPPKPASQSKDDKTKETKDSGKAAQPRKPIRATARVNYPLGAFGRTAASAPQQRDVVFRGATVWTCGKAGVVEDADVYVRGGKIFAIGKDLKVPESALVVNAAGKHITPGIIDCHSHMATDGGVNESTQAITAEVRIGDFIDADDINIYRQLAGGVTTSNILHGSANPIGGQNQVIKLRWGALPEQMKFALAPAGVKFALGENVKQSNWGDEFKTRYPQTRMGVEQIIRDAFQAAREYKQHHQAWRRDRKGVPPRRDLELEALAEIVDGERWIHCHSYRQDEILALIRTLDHFNIRIGTFQHILEGYKVAPEMARHGAMGSAFSDWWAYKFEVIDAIPYNGAIMHEAGVVVSFNSDDRELARHLNHEAAKAVKYGGVEPAEALKFVTLNPAKQLRIDRYVGSLERGKHADLVVWSGPPLSILSRCEQSWIEGRRYFDRNDDRRQRNLLNALRAKLIQKVLASGEAMLKPGEKNPSEESLWPREDLFCHHHDGHGHHHEESGAHEGEK
jgi:N-acetylglucosamine-6-phosphate deacetylase